MRRSGFPQGRRRRAILPGCARLGCHGADHGRSLRLHRQGRLRHAAVLTESHDERTTLLLGAVAYDPKVVTIWDGFQKYFDESGLPFDYILYTNYERQVEALFAGTYMWPGIRRLPGCRPSALPRTLGRRAEAICMRDTDRDLTSIVIARADDDVRTHRRICEEGESPSGQLIRRRPL